MSYAPFARGGPLLALSTVGAPGGDAEQQMNGAFDALRARLAEAGARPEDVANVVVNIADHAQRPHINPPWLDLFPDEHSRPARRTTRAGLPSGQLVQLQALAVPGASRQPLEIPGLGHRDPIPMGVRCENLVFSSALNGQVEGSAAQIDLTFQNAGRLMEIAGGSTSDVAHMWVFLKSRDDQPPLIDTWLRVFATDGDRPARKTVIPYALMGEQLVQAQLTAVLGGKRENYELEGVGHHDPIPMGCRIGPLLFTSGVAGIPAGSGTQVAEGLNAQLELAVGNLQTLLGGAGGSLRNVVYLVVMLRDFADEPAFRQAYDDAFGQDGPAVHVTTLGIPGSDMRVQLHAIAAF
jgi:enamine deaminase RidA (YjgF/YER057c/UK114 family)